MKNFIEFMSSDEVSIHLQENKQDFSNKLPSLTKFKDGLMDSLPKSTQICSV